MSNNSYRVLVVDDNRINRLKLIRALKPQGYDLIEAPGGKEALDILASQQIDLVLLDLLMPEIDGFQVLEKMRTEQQVPDIPVVMVTAVEEKEDLQKCMAIGAVDYITKPFDIEVLKERVENHLEKAGA